MNKTVVKRLFVALLITFIFSYGLANILMYIYSTIESYVIR